MRLPSMMLSFCLSTIPTTKAVLQNLDDDTFDGFVDSLPDKALLLVDFFTVRAFVTANWLLIVYYVEIVIERDSLVRRCI